MARRIQKEIETDMIISVLKTWIESIRFFKIRIHFLNVHISLLKSNNRNI